MDWQRPPEMKTWLLDDLFDASKGWDYTAFEVPLERFVAKDGNPNFMVKVDGINIHVYELRKWSTEAKSGVSPGRLVLTSTITGVDITNPAALCQGTYASRAMPALGLDDDKNPILVTSFPIHEHFPLDVARGMAKVCMGHLAEQTKDLIAAWNNNPKRPAFEWERAASVAGSFVRSFVGA